MTKKKQEPKPCRAWAFYTCYGDLMPNTITKRNRRHCIEMFIRTAGDMFYAMQWEYRGYRCERVDIVPRLRKSKPAPKPKRRKARRA